MKRKVVVSFLSGEVQLSIFDDGFTQLSFLPNIVPNEDDDEVEIDESVSE